MKQELHWYLIVGVGIDEDTKGKVLLRAESATVTPAYIVLPGYHSKVFDFPDEQSLMTAMEAATFLVGEHPIFSELGI